MTHLFAMGRGGKGKSTRAESTGETFYGVITEQGPKFGFIDCKPVFDKCGTDVFVPAAGLIGFNVGDKVNFELLVNQKGQPQAANLTSKGSAGSSKGRKGGKGGQGNLQAATATANGQETGKSFFGIIASIGGKFGFIDCPPIMNELGSDVFFPSAAAKGFGEGDKVDFELMVNKNGQPQASNIRPHVARQIASKKGAVTKGGAAAKSGSTTAMPTGESYFGVILSMSGKFGFIDCKPVRDASGLDVFFPSVGAQGFGVGDKVDFDLMINHEGKPQASNIRQHVAKQGKGGAQGWKRDASSQAAGKRDASGQGTGKTFFGVIASLGGKFGFIGCPPVMAQYGSDVFFPSAAASGYSEGDKVDFDLMFNEKGQPQASNIRASKRRRT